MKTMFQKVWESHLVAPETADTPAVLYVDLHLVHEVTSPQAFTVLRERGLTLRRPDLMLATIDHSSPTRTEQIFGGAPITIESAAIQIAQLERNCAECGVELFGLRSSQRGIVHIIGPELGLTQPGQTLVCGDSHTSTHGAFGALAFGIGSTEVGHVFATQCLLQRRPKTFALNIEGALSRAVTAKDLILSIIGRIGVSGGTGHVLEYRGAVIRALSMEERMTVCNMSIEAGARAGLDRHVAHGHALFHRQRANHRAAVFEYMASTAGNPDPADDRQDQVLCRDRAAQCALDVERKGLRPPLQQALGREHVSDFGRTDAEGEGAEGPVRTGVAVAADQSLAGLREPELRTNDVNDAALAASEAEQLDAELSAVALQLRDLNRGRFDRDRRAAEDLLGARRARMIDGREHQVGPAKCQAAFAQHREGLRRGHLVHQMQVDVQNCGRIGGLGRHHVRLPELLEHRLHLLPALAPGTVRARWQRCAC